MVSRHSFIRVLRHGKRLLTETERPLQLGCE
jgi:hypothetical protein